MSVSCLVVTLCNESFVTRLTSKQGHLPCDYRWAVSLGIGCGRHLWCQQTTLCCRWGPSPHWPAPPQHSSRPDWPWQESGRRLAARVKSLRTWQSQLHSCRCAVSHPQGALYMACGVSAHRTEQCQGHQAGRSWWRGQWHLNKPCMKLWVFHHLGKDFDHCHVWELWPVVSV